MRTNSTYFHTIKNNLSSIQAVILRIKAIMATLEIKHHWKKINISIINMRRLATNDN